MVIRDFQASDFESTLNCYQRGFPEGHSRYSLARLLRWFAGKDPEQGSILVAEDQGRIVGVVIGITSHWRAWITGLTVLPESKYIFAMCSLRLLAALGQRFLSLGFSQAYATTGRAKVRSLASMVGAELVGVEPNFFFDGQQRWIYRVDLKTFAKLIALLDRRKGQL